MELADTGSIESVCPNGPMYIPEMSAVAAGAHEGLPN